METIRKSEKKSARKSDPESQKPRISLPKTLSADLRGRQSVRATFRLSEDTIKVISIVAAHMGIKQKSLFDHLVEDRQALDQIARHLQEEEWSRNSRVSRTFVLSRKTLTLLEEASENFETSRDVLVEYSVRRLMPLIQKEREKHLRRKQLLRHLSDFTARGGKLLENVKTSLGGDDPFSISLEKAMCALKDAQEQITGVVEKGEAIEGIPEETDK